MNVFATRRIVYFWAAGAALLAAPAHAQLDDLFRAPGQAPQATQEAFQLEPEAPKPARPPTPSRPMTQKPAETASPGTVTAEKRQEDKVVIYTTPTCPHCIRALKHMKDRRIAYV
jgi:protein-disulfide isomerase